MIKSKFVIPVLLSFVSASALAADPAPGVDLSELTNNINFSGVVVAIMAVASALVALYAAYAGVRWVLRMVKTS